MNIDIRDRDTQIGIGLVLVGLLALFGNLGWFVGAGRLVGFFMFVVAGALVLRMYSRDADKLWTLPVGFGLVGLGLATLDMPWSAGAFLGSLGLGFLAIFLTDRGRWWAIIPGGVLLTLGLTATYDEWLRPGADGGTIFFLGLAATFAALYLLPSVNQRWAIWPALGLAVVAVLSMSFRGGWVLPLVLILVGAWMLSRQSRPSEIPPAEPSGGGSAGGGSGPYPSGGPGGDAGAGHGGEPAYRGPTSPVEPSVRTPAQTPGPAAVQPSPRPETPEQAVRREPATDTDADLPPYGQEPTGWTRTDTGTGTGGSADTGGTSEPGGSTDTGEEREPGEDEQRS